MGTSTRVGQVAAAVVAAVVAASLSACDAGPSPGPAAGARPAAPNSLVTERVSAKIPAPDGYRLQTVEFADTRHGYAALWTDDPVSGGSDPDPNRWRYASAIFATTDGGANWTRLKDPRPPSASPQMYTVDARTVVLLSEPDGWYVTTDGGASFRFSPGEQQPPELDRLNQVGPAGMRCDDGCHLTVRGSRVDPGLAGDLSAVQHAAGAVWAATVDHGVPRTAVSDDGGVTWRSVDVPAHPGGGAVFRLGLPVSPDGTEVWLVGTPVPAGGGVGQRAPRRRKEGGVPMLWRFDGQAWQVQGLVGAPAATPFPYSVAAIGAGLVAAVGPDGLSYVDEAWHDADLMPRPEYVTVLGDGTIFAPGPSSRVYYFGRRDGRDVSWTRLDLSA